MDHEEISPSQAVDQPNRDEELSFKIILCSSSGGERVIARAASPQLAQAIFKAAVAEFPDQRLLLSHDDRTIAETGKK